MVGLAEETDQIVADNQASNSVEDLLLHVGDTVKCWFAAQAQLPGQKFKSNAAIPGCDYISQQHSEEKNL